MNCAIKVEMAKIPEELRKDIDRIDEIIIEGMTQFSGPFLAGNRFSIADAFYCPVGYRINSYQLPVSFEALEYLQRLLAVPAMQLWDSAAINESWREFQHEAEAAAVGKIILDRRIQ